MNRLEIKVKDQFEKVYPAIALLKDQLKSPTGAELSVSRKSRWKMKRFSPRQSYSLKAKRATVFIGLSVDSKYAHA